MFKKSPYQLGFIAGNAALSLRANPFPYCANEDSDYQQWNDGHSEFNHETCAECDAMDNAYLSDVSNWFGEMTRIIGA
jgi:hypothetical protein